MRLLAAVLGVVALAIAAVVAMLHANREQPVVEAGTHVAKRKLRVCADPNNLPYSNAKEEGFENRIAALLARELDADLEYTWWAQRRGYIRNTLRAGECDVLAGVPTGMDTLLATAPYYRSSYVFVYRRDSGIGVDSLDAPELRRLRVGVQLVGDDYENTPPAHALARRGIVQNVRGYRVVGDYSQPNPPARIIEAVAAGDIDVAIAWGPMAGYFAARQKTPLEVVPVSPQIDLPFLPFVFDISLGVRRGEEGFRNELERAMERHRGEVLAILREYNVPVMDVEGT